MAALRDNDRQGMGGHHSPAMLKDEWLTPPEILRALGPFDLDPCAPILRPWPMAAQHYTLEDNGLRKPWHGRVWLNPPYGGPTIVGPWMRRMVGHGVGTALIFARTETAIFFETVWREATAVLFLEGRLFFHHVDGTRAAANAGAPSVLIAYGAADAARLQSCGISGQFVPTRCCKTFTAVSAQYVMETSECLPAATSREAPGSHSEPAIKDSVR